MTSDHREEPDSGTNDVLAALTKTVSSLQASMNATCSQLATSMTASLQMMAGMNSFMEHYVQKSLRVQSRIEPSPATIFITMSNCSAVPMADVSVSLALNDVHGGDSVSFTLEGDEGFEMNGLSWCIHKVQLTPGETRQFSLRPRGMPLAQYNGDIRITMPSPGTGNSAACSQALHLG